MKRSFNKLSLSGRRMNRQRLLRQKAALDLTELKRARTEFFWKDCGVSHLYESPLTSPEVTLSNPPAKFPAPVPKNHELSRDIRVRHHVHAQWIEQGHRFAASPHSAWDTVLMTLKEAVQFQIVSAHLLREDRYRSDPCVNLVSLATRESGFPAEVLEQVRGYLLTLGKYSAEKKQFKPVSTVGRIKLLREEGTLSPLSSGTRYRKRNHSPHVDGLREVALLRPLYERPDTPAVGPSSTGEIKRTEDLINRTPRLFVGDLRVFTAEDPPLRAEWGCVRAAKISAEFDSYEQALSYLRQAKDVILLRLGRFEAPEKDLAERLAKAVRKHETTDTYVAHFNYIFEQHCGITSAWANGWKFETGHSLHSHERENALCHNYRTGWVRKRWFCDCEMGTEDEDCPHACWWPSGKQLVPLSPEEGVRRSYYGQFDLSDPVQRLDLKTLVDFVFKASDAGIRMVRSELVYGGARNNYGGTLVKQESGLRYNQATIVRDCWYGVISDSPGNAWKRHSNVRPTTHLLLVLFSTNLIRKVSLQPDPVKRHLGFIGSVIAATKEVANLLDCKTDYDKAPICYPGDPKLTSRFESLVMDWSMPHLNRSTIHEGQEPLYTRYHISLGTYTRRNVYPTLPAFKRVLLIQRWE